MAAAKLIRLRPSPRWGRRAVALLDLACLLLAGCAASSITRDGPSVSARPFVDCRGTRGKGPTVVLQAGAFSTSADWSFVLRDLSKSGRVCAYDRLGLGASPDRVDAPTAENIARQLARTLDQVGEIAPVILVGHSNGAFYAETFATLYPDRVAGLAYVDGVGVDDLDYPLVVSAIEDEQTDAEIAAVGGRLGLASLFARPHIDAIGLVGPAYLRKWRALTSGRHLADARDEVDEILPALRRTKALGGVSASIPVAAIVASLRPDDPLDEAWRAAKAAPARRACKGWVLHAVGASHVSPLGRDRSYILAAVRWLKTPGLRASTTCTREVFKN
jgi:pimeloyl-ACP methyl ester carboxylesterase